MRYRSDANAVNFRKSCSGCQLTVDSTGSVSLIAMYNGASPYNNYGYAYNIQGTVTDSTLVTGTTEKTNVVVMDGQDTWFNIGGDIVYQARGTSGSGVKIYSNANFFISYMQLIGTKLYALIGTEVSLMSPIVKSGTGTFSTVKAGVTAFYISGTSLYTFDNQYINKYTLNAQGTSPTFQYQLSVINTITTVNSMYSTTVSGTTYLLIVAKDATTSYLYRLTDLGSNFSPLTTLLSTTTYTYYSVGPSPKATCSDTFQNQDETDVDCGGLICSGCAIGKVCTGNGDCLSNKCTNSLCGKSISLLSNI